MDRNLRDRIFINRAQFVSLLKTVEASQIINDWAARNCRNCVDEEELAHRFFDVIQLHSQEKSS